MCVSTSATPKHRAEVKARTTAAPVIGTSRSAKLIFVVLIDLRKAVGRKRRDGRPERIKCYLKVTRNAFVRAILVCDGLMVLF